MSEINATSTSDDQVKAYEVKLKKARKPKIVRAPGSFRFGVSTVAPTATYGPCAYEITIATPNAIGTDAEAATFREFIKGFGEFSELCVVNGYGIYDSTWKVRLDLNTGGKDVDGAFISAMELKMKEYFDTTPVLKADFASGKAKSRVLNGVSTVETDVLN